MTASKMIFPNILYAQVSNGSRLLLRADLFEVLEEILLESCINRLALDKFYKIYQTFSIIKNVGSGL
jgi:hypothetical protein